MNVGGQRLVGRVRLLLCVSAGALVGLPATAVAADTAAIDAAITRAVAQLEQAQQTDGSVGARLAVRDTATAAEAVRIARPAAPFIDDAVAFLRDQDETDVDSTSRTAIATRSAADAGRLLDDQRPDGGFGLSAEYESDALDTSLAVRALVVADKRAEAKRALDRLLVFRSGTSWGSEGDELLSGEALLAVAAYTSRYGSSTAYETALADGSAWLSGQQEAGGAWGEGTIATRTTATAVTALAQFAAYSGRVEAGADLLLTAQHPDGSWGDAYSTGLALRALAAAKSSIERANRDDLADPAIRARDLSADPQTVEPGKTVTVTATVRNSGAGVATGVVAEFHLADPSLGGDPVATANVPDIAPNSQVPVSRPFAVDKPIGRHKVHVVLRTSIDEDRDLANNRASLSLFVRAAKSTYPRTRDWPRAGRDFQHSGATPNRLHAVVDPTPIWRHRGEGQHIVAGGRVITSEGQHLVARNAKTGELAWEGGASYPSGDFRYRAPIYNRGWVYSAGIGHTSVHAASDGDYGTGWGGWAGDVPIWGIEAIPVEGAYDPTFHYLAGRNWMGGNDVCYIQPQNDPSGQFSWSSWSHSRRDGTYENGTIYFQRPCSDVPVAFSGNGTDRAYFSPGDSLLAFNPINGRDETGEAIGQLFAVELPGLAKSDIAPLMDSLGQVVVAGWEGRGDDDDPNTRPDPDSIQTGRGILLATDPSNGTVNWSFVTDARIDGSPIEYKGVIIVTDRSGRVYAIDQTNGSLKWSWVPTDWSAPARDQEEQAGQTLARSGRYLYVPHPDGSLYTLDARSGATLSSTAFPARPYDLAIDDENNAIYVRTLDGWVGAYPTQEQPQQCAPDPANAAPESGALTRVSAEPGGEPISGRGVAYQRPSVSGDGTYVAYVRETGKLNEWPYWAGNEIHVRNLETGDITTVPESDEDGTMVRTWPSSPALSDDGRTLVYFARTTDSILGALGEQIFVRDVETGHTEPLLTNPDGSIRKIDLESYSYLGASNYFNPAVSISGDGNTVAFATRTSLVPEDTDASVDAYVVDVASGQATLASPVADAALAAEHVQPPSLSRNGRFVAYSSWANTTGLPSSHPWYSESPYAYLFDRQTGEVVPVSLSDNGTTISNGGSPSVSADGSFVAFTSGSAALMPQPWRDMHASWAGGTANAYVWSRATRKSSIVTINDSDEVGRYNAPSNVSISDDGSYIAYQTGGWVTKYTSSKYADQIIGRDLTGTGKTKQLSRTRYGSAGNEASQSPAMSADGRIVAFISAATDLEDGDTNGLRDIYVLDRSKEPTSEPERSDDEPAGPECGSSSEPAVGYSDLNVTADDIHPGTLEQGQDATVEVDVRNTGDTASEATSVRLYDGTVETGKLIAERPLAALAPGADATVEFSWESIATAGSHKLTALVDPGEAVFQQDFADDEATRDVAVAAPQFTLTATSNAPAYAANATASFVAGIDNGSVAQRTATLELRIRHADGEHVGTVYDGPVGVLAGGHVDVPASWDVKDTNAGTYTLVARLLNADGDELRNVTREFAITPQLAPSLTLSASASTYAAGETAQLRAIVKNESVNAPLDGTKVQFTLTAPGSSTPQSWELSAGDIAAGKSVLVTQDRSTAGLAPGTYAISAKLVSSTGATLLTKTGSFVVAASSADGTGVSGTLTAAPADPQRGSTITFDASAMNAGNADITGAKFRVKIHDVADGTLVKTVDDSARTFGRAAPTTAQIATTADMTADRDYQASLHLVLSSGTEIPLDRKVFRVNPAPVLPVTTGASFDTSARSGVLVWACDRADEQAARTALSGTFASFVPDRSDPKYASTPGCGLFTSDEQKILLRLLRSGDYNQIWLLGRSTFLELNLANEIAARVIHGDSLLIAGTSLGFDLNLFGNKSPLGASGNLLPLLPGSYSLTFPTGSPFAGASGTIVGLPTALNPGSASVAATTTYGIWPLRVTSTLSTVNSFGNGKAVMFGASPKMFSNATDAANFLAKGKSALQPAASAVRPGGVVKLDLWVEGQSPGSPLEVRAILPAGASLIDKPSDVTLSGTTLTVPFSTTGTARRTRSVWVKVPAGATSVAVTQTAYAKDAAGTFVPVSPAATSSSLTVPATRAAAVSAAQAALNGVTAPTSYERSRLDAVKADVNAIATDTASASLAQSRLGTLLEDIGKLEKSNWSNTTPAWKALATLVTYVEFDLYRYGGQ